MKFGLLADMLKSGAVGTPDTAITPPNSDIFPPAVRPGDPPNTTLASLVGEVTARRPGIFPSFMTGPAQSAIVKAPLGAALGLGSAALVNYLMPDKFNHKRLLLAGAIGGGLAGAATSIPGMIGNSATGHSIWSSYPYTNAAEAPK